MCCGDPAQHDAAHGEADEGDVTLEIAGVCCDRSRRMSSRRSSVWAALRSGARRYACRPRSRRQASVSAKAVRYSRPGCIDVRQTRRQNPSPARYRQRDAGPAVKAGVFLCLLPMALPNRASGKKQEAGISHNSLLLLSKIYLIKLTSS